jgi:N-carbamoylputrescine amidase
MSLPKSEGEGTIEEIKEAMVQKHIPLIEEAGKKGVQILCMQEIFNTPYFCPGQDKKWYESAETMPGPTVERMQEYAKKYSMVMIVPMYEKEQAGVLYNTAAVIDADGTYLGKYRKNFSLNRVILVILFFKLSMQRLVYIYVMIVIFLMAPGY